MNNENTKQLPRCNPNDPAFPLSTDWDQPTLGLTKREYFACLLMPGAIDWFSGCDMAEMRAADRAVTLADALIARLAEEAK